MMLSHLVSFALGVALSSISWLFLLYCLDSARHHRGLDRVTMLAVDKRGQMTAYARHLSEEERRDLEGLFHVGPSGEIRQLIPRGPRGFLWCPSPETRKARVPTHDFEKPN